jgi:pimeloyl-ACP methyl ester carboxylesterase
MKDSAAPKASPTSHTYFSQRLKLHYLDWGNSEAKHLLLIHGVQDHCHNWDWTSEKFCDDYHVVVPDLRGHGDSDWSRGSSYSNLDYVYDIAQLVDQENLDPVNIIAHSMGGTIACLFAGIFPEKVASLISVEGVGGFWHQQQKDNHPQQRILDWLDTTRNMAGREPRKYPTLSDAFQRMQKSNPHLSEERARHLTIHGSNRNEDGTYTWKFDNYTHSRSPTNIDYKDMARLWEKIECPTLLLNAKQGFEHRTGQDGSDKYFHHSESIDIDNAGHWLHHDQFDEFIETTSRFLDQHSR